jgi:hypothetical protein
MAGGEIGQAHAAARQSFFSCVYQGQAASDNTGIGLEERVAADDALDGSLTGGRGEWR